MQNIHVAYKLSTFYTKHSCCIQRLFQEIEPLDPQAIETVENTMLYIQDMSLRNQSKILIQRLVLCVFSLLELSGLKTGYITRQHMYKKYIKRYLKPDNKIIHKTVSVLSTKTTNK